MIVSVIGTRSVSLQAAPERAVDLDDAADPLDIGAHHVHADAAPGDRGDRRRGGQAGREDQLEPLAARHLLRHARASTRPAAIAFSTSRSSSMPRPSSVDLDQDLVARLARVDAQHARRGLAGGGASAGVSMP